MPPKQKQASKQAVKRKRKKRQRPYKRTKRAHMIRRRRKHHRHEMRREAKMMNYLLHQMLKTMSADPNGQPFHYEPRHHTKDPEYKHSGPALQEFKRSVPSPDVHFWRPQGKGLPTHRGNFPRARWEPDWGYPGAVDDPAWGGYGSDADMY